MSKKFVGDIKVLRRASSKVNNIENWSPTFAYIPNDLFFQGNHLYLVKTAHTSPAVFDALQVEISQVVDGSFGGQFAGSSATFATLPPKVTLTGEDVTNGDYAFLTVDDLPNVKGIYVYDGTNYVFSQELEFKDDHKVVDDLAGLTTLAGTLTPVDEGAVFAYQKDTDLLYVWDGTKFINISKPPHKTDFLIADWVVSGTDKVITITGLTHTFAPVSSVIVIEAGESVGIQTQVDLANNDVKILVPDGLEFDGSIIIS